MQKRHLLVLIVLLPTAAATAALAQDDAPPPHPTRWFAGGGLGLGFGDIDYIEILPVIGMRASPRISVGLQPIFRYRKDSRFANSVSTTDYGATLFVQGFIYHGLFAELDLEYLDYEFVLPGLSGTDRTSAESVLVGGGYQSGFGQSPVSAYISVLYNLTYSSDDLPSPYNDPWVIRAGVVFGF